MERKIYCHWAILVNKKVLPCENLLTWARWFERANRHVDKTKIGDITVSTVFLGLDHGFGGIPMWFETVIFGGEHDGFQERYNSWEQAHIGHKQIVTMVEKCLT